MARARILKPGFFRNEELAECGMPAQMLFAGLWTLADRAGRLEDRPRRIKADIFPYYDLDVDQLLNELAKKNFIIRYEARGNKYIQVLTFSNHQKPHKNETESTIPSYEAERPKEEKAQPKSEQDGPKSEHSGLNLNPDYLNLNPESPKPPRGAFADPGDLMLFEQWWEEYPHKIGKGAAEKSYLKALKKAKPSELLRGLDEYKKSKPPDRPWCNPATWLNQQRWKDEPNEINKQNNRKSNSDIADDALNEYLAEQGITQFGGQNTNCPTHPAELRSVQHLREGPESPDEHHEGIRPGFRALPH